MSWSEYFPDFDASDEGAGFVAKNAQTPKDVLRVAGSVALELIDSGVVGHAQTYKFNVSLAGHANPNHEPTAGWSNDCVTVSVSQAGLL